MSRRLHNPFRGHDPIAPPPPANSPLWAPAEKVAKVAVSKPKPKPRPKPKRRKVVKPKVTAKAKMSTAPSKYKPYVPAAANSTPKPAPKPTHRRPLFPKSTTATLHVSFRFSDDDMDILCKLALANGLSKSSAMKMALRDSARVQGVVISARSGYGVVRDRDSGEQVVVDSTLGAEYGLGNTARKEPISEVIDLMAALKASLGMDVVEIIPTEEGLNGEA